MGKYESFREGSRTDWGRSNGQENLTMEQIGLGADLRLADAAEHVNASLREIGRLLRESQWCSFRQAVEKMADRGITVRHEHTLAVKLSWSIKWPWSSRAKRGRGKLLFWKPRKKTA